MGKAIARERSDTMTTTMAIWVWMNKAVRHWALDVTTDSVEMFSAITAVALGILLTSPLNTFESSPSFSFMRRVAPEGTWGIIMLLVGFIQLVGLNTSTSTQSTRRTMSLIAFVVYSLWAFSIAMGNVASTGTVIYGVLSLSMLWAHFNLEARNNARKPVK